jgi:hypothetical protein
MLTFILLFTLMGPVLPVVSEAPGPWNVSLEKALSQLPGPLRIEMVPNGSAKKPPDKPYQLGRQGYVRIIVKNSSDQRIKVTVVDTYYQNRPRLFKDGKLLKYREEISGLIRSKDKDPEFVRPGSIIFLEPYSSTNLEELNLSDWYGSLEPGSYKLTNRHRFEIDGSWTVESAELQFEVAPKE